MAFAAFPIERLLVEGHLAVLMGDLLTLMQQRLPVKVVLWLAKAVLNRRCYEVVGLARTTLLR